LINPVLTPLSDEQEEGFEGCLSVPGLRGFVERLNHIRYRGLDQNGQPFSRVARGFHARVVQHECDHLDGILYPRRMNDLSQLIFESEVRHWLKAVTEGLRAAQKRKRRRRMTQRCAVRCWRPPLATPLSMASMTGFWPRLRRKPVSMT
jgi:hypothetical protein